MAVVAVSLMRVPPTWDQPPRLPDESRIHYAITTALKCFICHTLLQWMWEHECYIFMHQGIEIHN